MKWIQFVVSLVLLSSLRAQQSPTDQLLDTVISHPGSYSQVCDIMTAPLDIPYQALELRDFAGASFSQVNQTAIQKNRDALVESIRLRLSEIDFARKPINPPLDPNPESNYDGDAMGNDPLSLNPLLLRLALNLGATEALPELLTLEQKLVDGIAKAKDNLQAPPPWVAGWFVAQEGEQYNEKEAAAVRDRRNNLFQARVAQRDLVVTIARLLREKSYSPYLNTQLEKAYEAGLVANARKFKLPKYQPNQKPLTEVDDNDVELDPITQLYRRKYDSAVLVPYSRPSRDEVRAAAAQWIAEHP